MDWGEQSPAVFGETFSGNIRDAQYICDGSESVNGQGRIRESVCMSCMYNYCRDRNSYYSFHTIEKYIYMMRFQTGRFYTK